MPPLCQERKIEKGNDSYRVSGKEQRVFCGTVYVRSWQLYK